jgi:4-carboxymuconolactone decarboxylase
VTEPADRYARGAARIKEIDGDHPERRQEAYRMLAEIAPDLPRFAVEFAYGDVHSRPGLDAARRELVIIGVLVALGDTEKQLASHLTSGLTMGLTGAEVVEAILQTLPYAGFPRTINAMLVAHRILAERGDLPGGPGSGALRPE